jgi:hypothetical protein
VRARDVLTATAALAAGVWVVGSAALPPDPVPVAASAPPVTGPAVVPAAPLPHVYSATFPDGSSQQLTLADDCGSGCFTMAGRRYLWMPDGQWRTPRFFDTTGVTCNDGHTEGAWAMWVTTDLQHFSSDIAPGDYCGVPGNKIAPATLVVTPAY